MPQAEEYCPNGFRLKRNNVHSFQRHLNLSHSATLRSSRSWFALPGNSSGFPVSSGNLILRPGGGHTIVVGVIVPGRAGELGAPLEPISGELFGSVGVGERLGDAGLVGVMDCFRLPDSAGVGARLRCIIFLPMIRAS